MRALQRVEPTAWARLVLFVAVFLVFSWRDGRFSTTNNVFTIFEGFAFLGLAALAVGVTIIAGELDLSVGSAAAVAGIISISVVDEIGLIPTVLLASLIGIAYGSLQGYLIYRLRIQSLVFTLGTLIGLRGLAFMISGENTVVMRDLEMAHAVRRQLWIFSPFSLVTLPVSFSWACSWSTPVSGGKSTPSAVVGRRQPRPVCRWFVHSFWPSPSRERWLL